MIEFENAGFSYGPNPVLRDISLTLAQGTFHMLLGPSGAGKSTLVRLAYADLAPTAGRVRFFGRPIARGNRNAVADLRRAVGVVHQDGRFLDHLTVIENIALPLQVSGIDMSDRAGDLAALLEWVELGGRASALPAELSRAERQRAALARAVILSPEVILADDPSGCIEWPAALELLMLLVELNRMGKTVLIATRDPALVRAARTQAPVEVLRLERGRLERPEAVA